MRSGRGITGTTLGIFLALLFGALAVLTLGFQLGNYQNPNLIKYCCILAAILFVTFPVALFWHWVKRWRPFTFTPADGSAAIHESFTPQKDVGGARGSRYYQGQPSYMPDIVRELATQIHEGKGPVLQELTFEGCQIYGPRC